MKKTKTSWSYGEYCADCLKVFVAEMGGMSKGKCGDCGKITLTCSGCSKCKKCFKAQLR